MASHWLAIAATIKSACCCQMCWTSSFSCLLNLTWHNHPRLVCLSAMCALGCSVLIFLKWDLLGASTGRRKAWLQLRLMAFLAVGQLLGRPLQPAFETVSWLRGCLFLKFCWLLVHLIWKLMTASAFLCFRIQKVLLVFHFSSVQWGCPESLQ